jgi:2-polyprenyl-3-methyl-5-hydroxy-6-metoxy-1,4-benzoquinol methylase
MVHRKNKLKMKLHIISPITKKENVKIVRKINPSIIIDQYRNQLNTDTSKYFENIDELFICKCTDSSYRFYYPTISGDASFYEELQRNRSTDYYSWRWEHEKSYIEIIKENDYVLDIGCGSGYFLSKISEKTTNIQGLESNDLAIEKCREKNIPVIKSDIQAFSKNNVGVFDVVCAFQVLEHINDVKSFIESSLRVLKPQGKLIIGVPNNNPYLHKYDIYHTLNLPPHHIGLWSEKSLRKLTCFFPMKIFKLDIEPNFSYDYWFNIQTSYFLRFLRNVCVGGFFKRLIYIILKKFNRFIKGRNLLVVYVKDIK